MKHLPNFICCLNYNLGRIKNQTKPSGYAIFCYEALLSVIAEAYGNIHANYHGLELILIQSSNIYRALGGRHGSISGMHSELKESSGG